MKRGLILTLCLLLPVFSATATPRNDAALQGLATARVIFDVNLGDPQKLLLRLNLIEETIAGLSAEKVKPEVVVAFRGGATLFMTGKDSYLPPEDLPLRDKIQAQVRHLKELGCHLEQCAVAVRLLKVDPRDIIPAVTLVGNGYISLIGYQNRGYALVPMD